jgi:hypothetical protein
MPDFKFNIGDDVVYSTRTGTCHLCKITGRDTDINGVVYDNDLGWWGYESQYRPAQRRVTGSIVIKPEPNTVGAWRVKSGATEVLFVRPLYQTAIGLRAPTLAEARNAIANAHHEARRDA